MQVDHNPMNFLKQLVEPGSVFEIRSPKCPEKRGGTWLTTASGYFDDVDKAELPVRKLEVVEPPAIYVTLNPVNPALLARSANRVKHKSGDATTKSDVLFRRWLMIDIDPIRPAGISSTDEEMQSALELAEKIEAELSQRGWSAPLRGMSGNGAYLFYRVELPNDDESEVLVKSFLHAIAQWNSLHAKVDLSTFDANRICKVLGTMARKGDHIADRPHRRSYMMEPEGSIEVVPREKIESIVCELSPKVETAAPDDSINDNHDTKRRAREYLAKMEPSISGQHGHNSLLKAASVLVNDFQLSDNEALLLLASEFNPRCEPPWEHGDIMRKISEAKKNVPQRKDKSSRTPKARTKVSKSVAVDLGSDRTENAVAVEFIDVNQTNLRYVPQWKKWLAWDRQRWKIDFDANRTTRLGRHLTRSFWDRISDFDDKEQKAWASFCQHYNKRTVIESVISLARCDERVVINHEILNANPLLLNLQNGTLNLQSGEFYEHRQTDLITQLANAIYSPDAQCPKWRDFIDLIFGDDAEVKRYIQALLGYSLSGDVGAHILPICYGSGANGKSTLWNAVVELLGDYAMLAPNKLLMGATNEHATEIASLYQRRLVAISEPDEGMQLREGRVKELTGDSTITARRMKEDFWSFQRTHKFWLSTNHLPQIQGTDEAIWRRIKLIPFRVDLRKATKPIEDYHRIMLKEEGSGILNWLIEGFKDWQANGFIEPKSVIEETKNYRGESDVISKFITECCEESPELIASSSELHAAYKNWGGDLTAMKFSTVMQAKFKSDIRTFGKYRNKRVFEGVAVQNATPTDNTDEDYSTGKTLVF